MSASGRKTFDTDNRKQKIAGQSAWATLVDASVTVTVKKGKLTAFTLTGARREPRGDYEKRRRKDLSERLGKLLRQTLHYLPAAPVRVGDRWTVSEKDVQPGLYWRMGPGHRSPLRIECRAAQLEQADGGVSAVIALEDPDRRDFLKQTTAASPFNVFLKPYKAPAGFEAPKSARVGEVRVRPRPGVHLDQTVTRRYSWHFIGGINRSGGGIITTRIRIVKHPKPKK